MEVVLQLSCAGILYQVTPRLITSDVAYFDPPGLTMNSGKLCLIFRQKQGIVNLFSFLDALFPQTNFFGQFPQGMG